MAAAAHTQAMLADISQTAIMRSDAFGEGWRRACSRQTPTHTASGTRAKVIAKVDPRTCQTLTARAMARTAATRPSCRRRAVRRRRLAISTTARSGVA